MNVYAMPVRSESLQLSASSRHNATSIRPREPASSGVVSGARWRAEARAKFDRYGTLLRWLSAQLWGASRRSLIVTVALDTAATFATLAGFVGTINVLLWLVLESARPTIVATLFTSDGHAFIAVMSLIAIIPLLFVTAAVLRFLANKSALGLVIQCARNLVQPFTYARLNDFADGDGSADAKRRHYVKVVMSEEDRHFNAAVRAGHAWVKLLACMTVVVATLTVAFLVAPPVVLVFLLLACVFGLAYVPLSYVRLQRNKISTELLLEKIKAHRNAQSGAFIETDRNDAKMGQFHASYATFYDNEFADYATVRDTARISNELSRELFPACASGFVLAMIYIFGGFAELPIFMITLFFFSLRLAIANTVACLNHLTNINNHYPLLRNIYDTLQYRSTGKSV